MKTYCFLLLFTLQVSVTNLPGVRERLETFVQLHELFYSSLADSVAIPEETFVAQFAPGPVAIDNDFCVGTPQFTMPGRYYDDIILFFFDNSEVVSPMRMNRISTRIDSYGRDLNGYYYAWVFRYYEYRRNGEPFYRSDWYRIKLLRDPSTGNFRILSILRDTDPPGDRDHDGIADPFDRCPFDPAHTMDGCPAVPKSLRS